MKEVHQKLRIYLIDKRKNKPFPKFIMTKQNDELIAYYIKGYLVQNTYKNSSKYKASIIRNLSGSHQNFLSINVNSNFEKEIKIFFILN